MASRVKEHGTEMGGAQGEELFWTLQGRLQVRHAWLELDESRGKWRKIKERRQHRASEAYTLLGRSLHFILRASELLAFHSPAPSSSAFYTAQNTLTVLPRCIASRLWQMEKLFSKAR